MTTLAASRPITHGYAPVKVQIQWNGFSDDELAAVKAPVLIAVGDRDFVRVEHAVEAVRRIPKSELAAIPMPDTSRCFRSRSE